MNQKELLQYIGSVEQIGGIRDFTFNDGKAKGVRAIEINTGSLCLTVLPDRCMDIAQASFKGKAFSWISKTGVTAPQYYEKDGTSWLRGFFGGLVTTCGLRNIGRPTEQFGLHGRLANLPAEKISVSARWEEDEYIMQVSGEMRECSVFGENLLLRRCITAKLFSNSFVLEDTVINQGFRTEPVALCYHCNFGYPLVQPDAKIVNVPENIAQISAPIPGKEEECIGVPMDGNVVTVGIENDTFGAYMTYDRTNLPDFMVWKMLGQSEYVVGLEPRTTNLGGDNIRTQNKYVMLEPFASFKNQIQFTLKEK